MSYQQEIDSLIVAIGQVRQKVAELQQGRPGMSLLVADEVESHLWDAVQLLEGDGRKEWP